MIIQHDQHGRITHVIGTYARGMEETLQKQGATFVKVKGRPGFNVISRGYIADGELMERPSIGVSGQTFEIVADGVDKASIKGLPDPCTVMVDGNAVEVASGVLELTSDMPATYELVIDHWPYLPWHATIIARAP